ncbi:unnamed protein product [Effrenium voratum]|uniref:Uncharacterized protein n=1 Tax=Effrenium voratum TaxID=2562239 RepID=A0AA36NA48_9DINO|nr:unnamed protein product [Effrenium voratum]
MPDMHELEEGDYCTERGRFRAGLLVQSPDLGLGSPHIVDLTAATVVMSMGAVVGCSAAALAAAAPCLGASIGTGVALGVEGAVATTVASVPVVGGYAAGAAGSAAGAAAGSAATGGVSGGLATAAPLAGAAGAAVLAVGGAIALVQAGVHQRVIYVVIANPSNERFELTDRLRNEGHITCPKVIPPHSAVGVVLHHSGCLSGFLKYESSSYCLMLGGSNPFIGRNKFRVELFPRKQRSLRQMREDTKEWIQLSGPMTCVADHYDNPSCASIILFQDEKFARAVKAQLEK